MDDLHAFTHYLTKPAPRAPHDMTASRDGWRWDGVIVGRAWPADMPDEELALMRVGGNQRKLALARADAGVLRCPRVELTEYERREARRLLDRHCLHGFEFHNVACNAGRTNLLNFLSFATTGANPGYTGIVAFGVGGTAGVPSSSDTALFGANELFRKGLTLTTISGNQIDASAAFAAAEGNFSYQDAGIFGSTSGNVASTTTVNTGILYAHSSYVYTKTSTVALSNDYYVSFS